MYCNVSPPAGLFFPKEACQTNQAPQMSAGKRAILQGAMLENEDRPLFDLE